MVSIVPNLLKVGVGTIAKRLQLVVALRLKTFMFHVKPYLVTRKKREGLSMLIITGVVTMLSIFKIFNNLSLFVIQ